MKRQTALRKLPVNIRKAFRANDAVGMEETSSLEKLLSGSFMWTASNEGFDFWNEVAKRAVKKESFDDLEEELIEMKNKND